MTSGNKGQRAGRPASVEGALAPSTCVCGDTLLVCLSGDACGFSSGRGWPLTAPCTEISDTGDPWGHRKLQEEGPVPAHFSFEGIHHTPLLTVRALTPAAHQPQSFLVSHRCVTPSLISRRKKLGHLRHPMSASWMTQQCHHPHRLLSRLGPLAPPGGEVAPGVVEGRAVMSAAGLSSHISALGVP